MPDSVFHVNFQDEVLMFFPWANPLVHHRKNAQPCVSEFPGLIMRFSDVLRREELDKLRALFFVLLQKIAFSPLIFGSSLCRSISNPGCRDLLQPRLKLSGIHIPFSDFIGEEKSGENRPGNQD